MRLKILTVLKSGGDYGPYHVLKIKDMCEKYIKDIDFSFFCLSDIDVDCETIPLEHNWPKWWSKIELFKQKGTCLFIDLDTIICGDISQVIEKISVNDYCMLKDQWHPKTMGSGIIYWSNDLSFIYNKFKKSPQEYISKFTGDQDFINDIISEKKYIQDYCDGEVVSFKANLNFGRDFNPDLHSIVYFHGPPRPWQQGVIPY